MMSKADRIDYIASVTRNLEEALSVQERFGEARYLTRSIASYRARIRTESAILAVQADGERA